MLGRGLQVYDTQGRWAEWDATSVLVTFWRSNGGRYTFGATSYFWTLYNADLGCAAWRPVLSSEEARRRHYYRFRCLSLFGLAWFRCSASERFYPRSRTNARKAVYQG